MTEEQNKDAEPVVRKRRGELRKYYKIGWDMFDGDRTDDLRQKRPKKLAAERKDETD